MAISLSINNIFQHLFNYLVNIGIIFCFSQYTANNILTATSEKLTNLLNLDFLVSTKFRPRKCGQCFSGNKSSQTIFIVVQGFDVQSKTFSSGQAKSNAMDQAHYRLKKKTVKIAYQASKYQIWSNHSTN